MKWRCRRAPGGPSPAGPASSTVGGGGAALRSRVGSAMAGGEIEKNVKKRLHIASRCAGRRLLSHHFAVEPARRSQVSPRGQGKLVAQ